MTKLCASVTRTAHQFVVISDNPRIVQDNVGSER